MSDLTKFIVHILISGAAALLGALLAAKRFRVDRSWELKMRAYSELMEALHKMKWPASENLDAANDKREIPDEENQKLWEELLTGKTRLVEVRHG